MIKKPLLKPLILAKLERTLPRVPKNHPEWENVETALKKYRSGYRGETSTEYYLSFLPEKETFILHNLRLKDKKGRHFQIDTLIITPNFLLNSEIKNHAGTLIFDPILKQFIQKVEGENDKIYGDPVIQAKGHENQLKSFMSSRGFPQIPIISLVIISNPSSTIKLTSYDYNYQNIIIHSQAIPEKYNAISKSFRKEILSIKDCNKLSRILIRNHEPLDRDVLTHFHILPSEIIKGNRCPECNTVPMKKVNKCHNCQKCGYQSTDVYLENLYDYALIYGREITNQQCQDFLKVSSATAYRILKKYATKHTGKYKNSVYILPYPPDVD